MATIMVSFLIIFFLSGENCQNPVDIVEEAFFLSAY